MQSLRSRVAPLSALTLAAMMVAWPAFAQQAEPGNGPPAQPPSEAPGGPPPPPPSESSRAVESGGPTKSAYVLSRLNLRQGPGIENAIVTVIPAGSTVRVSDCTNGWCAVEWHGQQGYAIMTNLEVGRVRRAEPSAPSRRPYAAAGPEYGEGPTYYGPPPAYYAPPPYYSYYYGPRYYWGPRWGYYYRPW
jgi:hypothetical protein